MKSPIPTPPDESWLSALIDGEHAAVDKACALWRDDARARRDWYAYHVIGDTLRSEELAGSPTRDAAFMAGFRARLAQEPALLAPASLPSVRPSSGRRHMWRLPAAVAAGFFVVSGVILVSGRGVWMPGGNGSGWSAATGATGGPASGLASQSIRSPQVIHDPYIEQLLQLHRRTGNGAAMPVSGMSLRQVDTPIATPAAPAEPAVKAGPEGRQ